MSETNRQNFKHGRDYKVMIPKSSVKSFITIMDKLRDHYGSYAAAEKASGVNESSFKRARQRNVLSHDNAKKVLGLYNKVKDGNNNV